MAWKFGGGALLVTDSFTVFPSEAAELTSVSPLLLDAGGGSYYLRLYGIKPVVIDRTVGDVNPALVTPCDKTTASPWSLQYTNAGGTIADTDWLTYYDSATFAPGGFSGVLDFEKATSTLVQTCIPVKISGARPTINCITDVTTGTTTLIQPETGTLDLVIQYRDPHVIALPDDTGYLMVLVRYVHVSGVDNPTQDDSRTQIVAWWSTSADFSGPEVYGPLLLVDDMQCWKEDQTFRLWVGVPGAVLVRGSNETEDALFVYYVIEQTKLAQESTFSTSTCGESLNDDVASADYQDRLTAMEATWGALRRGVACKKLLWNGDHGLKAIMDTQSGAASPLGATSDLEWDPASDTVPGELLGMIRCWFSDGHTTMADLGTGSYLKVPSFTNYFDVYSPDEVRYAAPCPVSCGGGRTFGMVLATTVSKSDDPSYAPAVATDTSLGTGHGIWRGRPLPATELLYDSTNGTLTAPVFGVDFVFSPLQPFRSKDQIAESGLQASGDTSIWIDPAALLVNPNAMADSSIDWWVVAGRQNVTADGNVGGTLAWFYGTWFDGCQTWSPYYWRPIPIGADWARSRFPFSPPEIAVDKAPFAGRSYDDPDVTFSE